MNGSDDLYNSPPPSQVSHFGPQGWSSLGASTSQMSQQRGSNQQPQYPPQRRLGTSSQTQNTSHEASASRPQTPRASQMQSNTNSDRNLQLSRLSQGLELLREQIEVFARVDTGSIKKDDKKKKFKEGLECRLCHRIYANQTTLARHYKSIHNEFNPERFDTANDTVLSPPLADTPQKQRCGICGYVTFDRNALDSHNYFVHSNDVNKCKSCGYKANSKADFDDHARVCNNGNVSGNNGNANGNNGIVSGNNCNVNTNGNNTNNIQEAVSKMHKCEDCECYFADKNKFDDHMKVMHGFDILCRTCNKNFSFKNIERHMRDNHPDLYEEFAEKRGNDEKSMRTKTGKYNQKLGSKMKPRRRGSIHRREFRRHVESNASVRQVNTNANGEDTQTTKDIMYVCEACDIATATYDVAIEHSQKHIADPDIKFTVVNCDTCQLKFEPICYEKHLDLHYTKKDVTKEYFKHLKYKYQLLFTNEWLNFFNMEKDAVDKIVSGSMYAATRAVKMRVVANSLSFTNTLYQCRQCDNFIEAATVLHHALNFDTCVRIRNSFPCNVCDRSFNIRSACDDHEATHTGDETFRTVAFNADNDREFNYKLNNNEVTESKTERTATKENEATEKVIYKCLCGLCFVSEDSAKKHLTICPGSDKKLNCKTCNNLFNLHELMDHYYQHHLDQNIRLVVRKVVPDVIEISDDECKNDAEAIEILSSDDDENDDSNQTPDTNGVIKVEVTDPSGSDAVQGHIVTEDIETTRDVPMDEDNGHSEPTGDENPGHADSDGVSDDETPHSTTNSYDHSAGEVSSIDEKKSAETCLLNKTEVEMHVHESNNISATNLDIAKVKTEPPTIEVKEETPWYVDNDVYVDWRSEGQSNAANTDVIFNLDDILTDDEDEEMTPVNEQTDAQNNTNDINEVQASTEEVASDENTMEYDVQNDMNSTEKINDTTEVIDNTPNHGILDVYRPNVNVSIDDTQSQELVLSERRIVLNTSSISTENGSQIIEPITRRGESENVYGDTEYEQMRRNVLRNIENNIVLKYLERLSRAVRSTRTSRFGTAKRE